LCPCDVVTCDFYSVYNTKRQGGNMYYFDSVIFDLDGVITKTALVHQQAWKKAFNEYLKVVSKKTNGLFREFTYKDYLDYVDGKPRYDGVKSFLESRNINIEWGDSSDSPDRETICGIGNKKNGIFVELLKSKDAEVYPSTIEFIKELKKAGIKIGVASSSKNCKYILESAGISHLFETRVDGVVSSELKLKGKPEGDIFVRAAYNLNSSPSKSVVVEDAASGVEAGRNGGFGLVIGIARKDNSGNLLRHHADIVVDDLSSIDINTISDWFLKKPVYLFESWQENQKLEDWINSFKKNRSIYVNEHYFLSAKEIFSSGRKNILFLDYDGTLTPIVEKPQLAVLSPNMKDILERLHHKYTIAIVSGRLREDVENLVGIDGIFYAGSHGFDIKGPSFSLIQPDAEPVVPLISKVTENINNALGEIEGVIVEDKKFSVAVHYRLIKDDKYLDVIRDYVDNLIKDNSSLRLMKGKKVFEIMPRIDWDKGRAIRWIMRALGVDFGEANVVYAGDDTTDEDAFRVIRTRGVGILVSDKPKESAADFRVSSPLEVKKLFEDILRK